MAKGVNAATGRGTRFLDRSGHRSGRLVFIRSLGENKHRHQVWEAVCDCGATTTTTRPNTTKSCGCLQREVMAAIQSAKALPPEERRRRLDANRVRQRARRRSDPLRAMQARLSRLHRHAISQVGGIKSSPTFDELGYSAQTFVQHIERQFVPGMGWGNMSEWQIDHILPMSTAKTVADVVALNQLSNLRPMWAIENNAKKDKILTLL